MPPPAQERWAIFCRIPKVVATAEAMGVRPPVSSSISVDRDEPPCASCSPCRAASPPPPTTSGPDILPSCFSKDRFSVGPDFKKLEKRFAAAQGRSTAAKPVTFAAAPSRLTAVKPDTHDKGIRLKRIRDHDDMQMEELEAKRMKLKAVFSQVIESRKKQLMGSLTMKEGAMSAIDV
ncbi:hypothetical protein GQ55_3G449500 [Panicum hallii var. hallii]|uniref:Uncharacterized protein n=1 Tax=Panicum hallii var. hallii TaxID=1504633 RepID=A0A2T7EIF5_9POAL|nr:hypothetical protein GQ55_3G449500 [Panicum hallii var. hallii]